MNITPFESTKQVSEFGREYWTAREFCAILEYKEYRNFLKVVKKAKDACINSGHDIKNHFIPFTDMVPIWSWALRKIENIKLSRYASYLIVQNADPNKSIVAQWQSYFAEQTRKQELMQDPQYREDQLRVETRKELTDHQRELFSTAKKAWVRNYWSFQNAWYEWMYWWLDKNSLAKKKWLKKNDNVFDYMSSEELWANLFRTTQTEAKLKRELEAWHDIWQKRADSIHFVVWEKVRATIHEIWGTMPENLPAAEHIDKAVERLETLWVAISSWESIDAVTKKYEIPEKQNLNNKDIIKTKKEAISYHFSIPWSVKEILSLKEIIQKNPWNKEVIIWNTCYHCSKEWVEIIRDFYKSE